MLLLLTREFRGGSVVRTYFWGRVVQESHAIDFHPRSVYTRCRRILYVFRDLIYCCDVIIMAIIVCTCRLLFICTVVRRELMTWPCSLYTRVRAPAIERRGDAMKLWCEASKVSMRLPVVCRNWLTDAAVSDTLTQRKSQPSKIQGCIVSFVWMHTSTFFWNMW